MAENNIHSRLSAVETHVEILAKAQRNHEVECIRYRERAEDKLAGIDAKLDLVSATMQTWKSFYNLGWGILAGIVGWAGNAIFQWWMGQ